MLQLYAEQIDTLTVQDLGQDMTVINVIDKGNMTEERFAKLRYLTQQPQPAQPAPLDTELLDKKLRNIREPSTASSSPTPGPDETAERLRSESYDDYNTLIQMGGIPSAPIQPDSGVWDPAMCDEHLHVYRHWILESRRIREELDRWKAFCKYRMRKRETEEAFKDYKRILLEYRVQQGIPLDLDLLLEMDVQNKLELWKEYYLYEHRKLARLERRIQAIEQLPERQQSWEGRLWSAKDDLNVHKTLLAWIMNQLDQLSVELGCSLKGAPKGSHQEAQQCLRRSSRSLRQVEHKQFRPNGSRKHSLRKSKRLSERMLNRLLDTSRIAKPARKGKKRIDRRKMISTYGPTSHVSPVQARGDELEATRSASDSGKSSEKNGGKKSRAMFNINCPRLSKVSKQRRTTSQSVQSQRRTNTRNSEQKTQKRSSRQPAVGQELRRSARIRKLLERQTSMQTRA